MSIDTITARYEALRFDAPTILQLNYNQATTYPWPENLVPAHFMMYCATNWATEKVQDVLTNYSAIAAQARACDKCRDLAGVLRWMLETNGFTVPASMIPSMLLGYKIKNAEVSAYTSSGADLFTVPLKIMTDSCEHLTLSTPIELESESEGEDEENYILVPEPGVQDFYTRLKNLSSFASVKQTWYDYQVDWNGGQEPAGGYQQQQPMTVAEFDSSIQESSAWHAQQYDAYAKPIAVEQKALKVLGQEGGKEKRRERFMEEVKEIYGGDVVKDDDLPPVRQMGPGVTMAIPAPEGNSPAKEKFAVGYSKLSGNAWKFLVNEGGGSDLLDTIVRSAESALLDELPKSYMKTIQDDDPRLEYFTLISEEWKAQLGKSALKRFSEAFQARVINPSRRVLEFAPTGNPGDKSTVNDLLRGDYASVRAFVLKEGYGCAEDFIALTKELCESTLKEISRVVSRTANQMKKGGDPNTAKEAENRVLRFQDAANSFIAIFGESRRNWRESAKATLKGFGSM